MTENGIDNPTYCSICGKVCFDCKTPGGDNLFLPYRRHLPDERKSITHHFNISGYEGYITAGMYDDGSPGELFIRMAKEGSIVSGLMDGFATMASIALQYGVPLDILIDKFVNWRFEPSGITRHPDIAIAKSLLDYLFRWLQLKFAPAHAIKKDEIQ